MNGLPGPYGPTAQRHALEELSSGYASARAKHSVEKTATVLEPRESTATPITAQVHMHLLLWYFISAKRSKVTNTLLKFNIIDIFIILQQDYILGKIFYIIFPFAYTDLCVKSKLYL